MASFTIFNSCLVILRRNISFTTSVQLPQDSRFMKKILSENKSKKKWRNSNVLPIAVPVKLAEGANEGKRSSNSRRVAVLNKLFMRHITDLMATGENASVFLGRGIEINRVMVAPDFKFVNVFWIAKGTEDDDRVENLLSSYAGALRHELSQLRVMGMVPRIQFVKDKEYAKLIEVDLRLARADFGEDYVPVEPSYRFKSELSVNTQLPPHVQSKIEDLEEAYEEEEHYEELPPMRMDVLGLNHAEIMSKVQKSIKKSQALHRKSSENKSENEFPVTVNENPIQYENYRQQREAFTQFLLKRQIMQAKAKKEKEKYPLEYEFMRNETQQHFEATPFFDELKDAENDYIEEQDDDSKGDEKQDDNKKSV